MSKLKVGYDKIFLVGIRDGRRTKHHVTLRDAHGRPGFVQFSGQFVGIEPGETYGTLVLDSNMWKQFSDREMIPGCETPGKFAATLVARSPNHFYGCPLCAFKTKNRKEDLQHIREHTAKFLTQFKITVEEDEQDGSD